MCLRAQFSCAAELCIIICAGHESMGQIERGANVRTALYYYAVWAAKTIIMRRDTYECVCVLCIDTFLLMPFAWLCVIIGQEFGERVVTFCIKCVIQMRCIIMAHQFNFAPVVGIESTKTIHYMGVNVKKNSIRMQPNAFSVPNELAHKSTTTCDPWLPADARYSKNKEVIYCDAQTSYLHKNTVSDNLFDGLAR